MKCGSAILLGMGKLFERSLSRWRGLSAVQKIVVCAAVACVTLWGGSKEGAWPNSTVRMARQRLASGSTRALSIPAQTVNTVADVNENDIARGWRVVSETVGNALVPMPADAVTNELLRRRGGFEWAFRVEPEGWRFPYAGGALTGVTVLARGEVRPNARTTFFPVPLTNGVSLLPMARWNLTGGEPSVFAHAVTPSNSLLLAWWNALVGRDANCPTNLQMELFADGADLLLADAGLSNADYHENAPHLSARLCGKLAKDACAKQLVLTHLNPKYDPELLLNEAREVFPKAELAEIGGIWYI